MEVNSERLDKALHYIPIVILHLQIVQTELMELRQSILCSIEDEKQGGQDERQTDESSDNICSNSTGMSRDMGLN